MDDYGGFAPALPLNSLHLLIILGFTRRRWLAPPIMCSSRSAFCDASKKSIVFLANCPLIVRGKERGLNAFAA